MAGEYYSGIRKTRRRGDLWETIGKERKTKRAAVEHSRGEGTEMRVEQAWIEQPVVKGSLSPVRIKNVFFGISSPCFSFFYCCSAAFSAWLLPPSSLWVESEEDTSVGQTLPLTGGHPSPWGGTPWGRGTVCGSQDSHLLLSCRLNLGKLFSQLE